MRTYYVQKKVARGDWETLWSVEAKSAAEAERTADYLRAYVSKIRAVTPERHAKDYEAGRAKRLPEPLRKYGERAHYPADLCGECGRSFTGETPEELAAILEAHAAIAHKPEPAPEPYIPDEHAETPGAAALAAEWIAEDRAASVRETPSRPNLRLVPRDWPPAETDEPEGTDPAPTGTDGPRAGGETESASEGDSARAAGATEPPAEQGCKHPPTRVYSWFAFNHETGRKDIFCAGCCACGEVLAGGV